MRQRSSIQRRGLVFVAAVLLIALIGAAIGAISSVVAADAQRSRDRARDAQLEQLLLAAAADAPSRLLLQTPVAGQSWAIQPPTSLGGDAKLVVHVESVETDGQATLLIQATIDGHQAEQQAIFSGSNSAWALTAATLVR